MKYFRCLDNAIDTKPFLDEIDSVQGAWDLATGRQEKIAVQREAQSIPLRGLRRPRDAAAAVRPRRDVHESRWTTGSKQFPFARQFLADIAALEDALLSRAKIVCLPAGRRVYPHIDRGEYYLPRNRFHLVLHSTAGSWLKAGDEEVRMRRVDWGPRLANGLDEFLSLPIEACAGADDNVSDANTRRGPLIDLQQGSNRLQRAWRWVSALHETAVARGIQPRVKFSVLPGCGHGFRACVRRGGLAERVLPAAVTEAQPLTHRPPLVELGEAA